jgi:hypothetical protein
MVIYKRFIHEGRNFICVSYLCKGDNVLIMDEEGWCLDVMEKSRVESLPEVPYGDVQKGDYVFWNGKTYYVIGDKIMRMNGQDFKMPPDVQVIRRFQPGFSVVFGNNRYRITEIQWRDEEYPSLRLEARSMFELLEMDKHYLTFNEYTFPFYVFCFLILFGSLSVFMLALPSGFLALLTTSRFASVLSSGVSPFVSPSRSFLFRPSQTLSPNMFSVTSSQSCLRLFKLTEKDVLSSISIFPKLFSPFPLQVPQKTSPN